MLEICKKALPGESPDKNCEIRCEFFPTAQTIQIDYALMEKWPNSACVVPSSMQMEWCSSRSSLWETASTKMHNNVVIGGMPF